MKTEPVKFGIVGCGGITNAYHIPRELVPLLIQKKKADLVAVCDSVEERARLTKERWHAKGFYTDFDEMLEKADIDAVIIATSMNTHASLAIKAAKAGKHFFVQKPMATNMKDADAVVEETRKAKVKAQVRPDTPLSTVYVKAREIIKECHIGRPLWFQSGFGRDAPDWGAETFFSKEAGGALFDLGVYSIAPVTYVLGPAKRVVGLATISIPTRSLMPKDVYTKNLTDYLKGGEYRVWDPSLPHEDVKIGAEDNTFTLLDMGNGCLGLIISNFIMPHGLMRPIPEASLEVYGEQGGLIVGGVAGSSLSILSLIKDSKYRTLHDESASSWYHFGTMPPGMNQLVHFVDCIVNDKDPLPNVEWGRHISEIMIKSIESARTGKALNLESTF
jgi:predicted dehydrogenase